VETGWNTIEFDVSNWDEGRVDLVMAMVMMVQ
jgi:hypothetical protein